MISVYHVIPSIRDDSGEFVPDFRFALNINEGMTLSSQGGIPFITTEGIDFSSNTDQRPLSIEVFSRNDADEIDSFLLMKQVQVKSAEVVTQTFNVGSAEQFLQLELDRSDAIEILSVVDSDGNPWYEVEYLAQDIVTTEKENIELNDSRFSRFKTSVPYILGSLKTSRKFITLINSENRLVLEFGSGDNVEFQDEEINSFKEILSTNSPNSTNSINPLAFLNGRNYGLIPKDTTLTVKYLAGGGVESNISSGEITNVTSVEFGDSLDSLNANEQQLRRSIRNSIRVTNTEAASGGMGIETDTEIRNNAILYFNSQNRVVSSEDYLVKVLSLPAKYGSVSKAYVTSEDDIDSISNNPFVETDKSFGVNIYVLGYDGDKKLSSPNKALIHNISEHIRRNRILTDDITIFSGNIINIGVDFDIIAYKGENKQEILFKCIETVKEFFDTDNMNFNQPINLNTLSLTIGNVVGVQSVSSLRIKNLTKADGDYSLNRYNIDNLLLMVYYFHP